jgi:hypothetical protein
MHLPYTAPYINASAVFLGGVIEWRNRRFTSFEHLAVAAARLSIGRARGGIVVVLCSNSSLVDDDEVKIEMAVGRGKAHGRLGGSSGLDLVLMLVTTRHNTTRLCCLYYLPWS